MSRLSELYRELTREYVRGLGCEVPERYQSSFVAWGGSADVQHIYSRWAGHLSHSAKVLVVGVVGGRDFFLMRSLGFDVIGVDVAEHPEIDPVVTANIEDELPFEENEFDLVIVSEVLEHLRRDVDALEHIARVLKPNGKLIVSLPYYNDHAEGHVRVHSPLSASHIFAFVVIFGFLAIKPRRMIFSDVQYLARLDEEIASAPPQVLPELLLAKAEALLVGGVALHLGRRAFHAQQFGRIGVHGSVVPDDLQHLLRLLQADFLGPALGAHFPGLQGGRHGSAVAETAILQHSMPAPRLAA